jgi:hypothetical protein
VEKVDGGRSTLLVGHMAWPADHHLAPNRLLQVDGANPQLYKYPYSGNERTHTPHFGDSTCKASILSVVARRSFIGRVARL